MSLECGVCGGYGIGPDVCSGAGDVTQHRCDACGGTGRSAEAGIIGALGVQALAYAVALHDAREAIAYLDVCDAAARASERALAAEDAAIIARLRRIVAALYRMCVLTYDESATATVREARQIADDVADEERR